MGRSQETFSKKEKEKNKVQKKKEKEEKKVARQSDSKNGKNLDEMLAYVDEFGNITATPPDPKMRKAIINQEDIQISVSRQAPIDPETLIRKGIITFFNDSKGYGFIRDLESQESIFVHINSSKDKLQEQDRVTFEVEKGPKGLTAVKVALNKA